MTAPCVIRRRGLWQGRHSQVSMLCIEACRRGLWRKKKKKHICALVLAGLPQGVSSSAGHPTGAEPEQCGQGHHARGAWPVAGHNCGLCDKPGTYALLRLDCIMNCQFGHLASLWHLQHCLFQHPTLDAFSSSGLDMLGHLALKHQSK
eukprot:scaffold231493_cov20-Tisochrysis_lutea.AAC.1